MKNLHDSSKSSIKFEMDGSRSKWSFYTRPLIHLTSVRPSTLVRFDHSIQYCQAVQFCATVQSPFHPLDRRLDFEHQNLQKTSKLNENEAFIVRSQGRMAN